MFKPKRFTQGYLRNISIIVAFITLSFSVRAELLQFNRSLNLDPGIHGLQVPGQSVISANGEYLYLLGIEANVISVLQRSASDNSLGPLFLYSNDDPDIDGIFLPWKAALSPAAVDNNQYLYVISRSSQDTVVSRPDTLAVFQRDTATGELTFVDVYQDTADPLDFNFPGDIVVSPDGNHIYVTGVTTNSIATFQFDAVNGQLNLLDSLRNGDSSNSNTIFGLNSPQSLAISPDGRHIYVATFGADAIVAFSRDTVSGILGYEFTLSNNDSTAGGAVAGLVNPIDIEISRDGNFVYTANAGDSSVTVFQRNSVDGSLDFVETYSDGGAGQSVVDSLDGITAIQFSPDNNHLVALSGLLDNSLTVFNRDSATGELGSHQVIADDVNGSFGIANSLGFVFTGDYRGLITFSNNRKLGIFDNCTGVAPAANAGSDQIVDEGQAQAVQLDASASGSTTNCRTVTDYAWSQIAGPVVTLQGANTAQPTFTPLASVDQDTQLVFELTVSNSMGATSTATVAVTIRDTSCSGIVPVADAGTDITVVENSESSVQLDGSGSAVSCGSITQYDWHQTAGPEVVVQNADTATPSFSVFDSIDHNIDLVFELTVTSNNGATDASSVTVTLVNLNEAPVLVNDLCIIEPGANLNIDVLSNDSDTDGPAALQIVSRDTPPDIQGAVSFSENGVQYTAPPTLLADGQGGVVPVIDRFSYNATDSVDESTTDGEVSVLVNELPELQDDVYQFNGQSAQTLVVLANDRYTGTDPVILLPESGQTQNGGQLALNSDGTVLYTAPETTSGLSSDSFIYSVVSSGTRDFAEANGLHLVSDNPACLQATSTGQVIINFPVGNTSEKAANDGPVVTQKPSSNGGGAFVLWDLLMLIAVTIVRKRVLTGASRKL